MTPAQRERLVASLPGPGEVSLGVGGEGEGEGESEGEGEGEDSKDTRDVRVSTDNDVVRVSDSKDAEAADDVVGVIQRSSETSSIEGGGGGGGEKIGGGAGAGGGADGVAGGGRHPFVWHVHIEEAFIQRLFHLLSPSLVNKKKPRVSGIPALSPQKVIKRYDMHEVFLIQNIGVERSVTVSGHATRVCSRFKRSNTP